MGCLVMSNSCVPASDRSSLEAGARISWLIFFVPKVIERRKKVVPYHLDSFWYDIGSTEAYERLDDVTLDKSLGFFD